jgi:DNA-binding beta-propeller fold protein YncE
MKRNRNLFWALSALVAWLVVIFWGARDETALAQGRGGKAPVFQVDPLWPKPLPNHWILGSVTGVTVDGQDHIWVVHRGADSHNALTEIGLTGSPPTSEGCCLPAPFVLEFDAAGNLVSHWGGSGQNYAWPQSPSGIAVDPKGSVWIAGAGPIARSGRGRGGAQPAVPPPTDAHVLKFSRTGQFQLQIGQPGKPEGSDSKTSLNRPTALDIDPAANELYVADGVANHRVVVFDATTGAYKRHWGAYGEKPDDVDTGAYDPGAAPAKQFRTVSCVKIARDGLVYVCDRRNNRIQVFQKDGKFVKEAFVSKTTKGEGSVWDIAFSRDPQQRFIYVADGQDQKVFVLQRDTLDTVSSIGGGGRWPGHFYGVGSVAVDSKGNVYTGENLEGKRVQKFAPK